MKEILCTYVLIHVHKYIRTRAPTYINMHTHTCIHWWTDIEGPDRRLSRFFVSVGSSLSWDRGYWTKEMVKCDFAWSCRTFLPIKVPNCSIYILLRSYSTIRSFISSWKNFVTNVRYIRSKFPEDGRFKPC